MTQKNFPPNQQNNEEKTNASRRKFLQNVGLAGLSAGAAKTIINREENYQ
jgi:hypothetical protein